MDAANLSDVVVEAWRGSVQRPTIASRVEWGPVREQAAALAGSAREAKSICIAPQLSQFVVAAALECAASRSFFGATEPLAADTPQLATAAALSPLTSLCMR